MKKTNLMLSILLFTLMLVPLSAQDVNVAGDWEISMTMREREMTRAMTIEQDGEKIKVTMEGFRGGDETIGEGTIKGNKIEWTITRESQRGEITMEYSATVDGDTMTGEVSVGDFGSFEFTAKKK
jgi:hypothetical protein